MIGGRFRIESFLSQDGVSQTYRAADTVQGAPASVRVIPLRVLGTAAASLEEDVDKASAIVHKNLVEVLMVGREADFYFIATELLDGQSLREFIDGKRMDGRGVSLKGACNLISHVTNGLEKAYGVMAHGGLNPASIWVNKAGRVKVADLGLTRTLPALARRGAPAGGPDSAYVAPELVAGGDPTPASDVYSLGVILYEVLTGRLPASIPPPPITQLVAEMPAAVDTVVARALSKSPANRWQSPAELKHALADVLGGSTARAMMVPSGGPGGSQSGSRPPAPGATFGLGELADSGVAPLVPGPPGIPNPPAPPPATPGEPSRLTLGRSFNVVEAAAGAADDNQERWLIQKDRLDFGPYSLTQIRAQIERGEILGDHMIVDSDSGARKKVKDFPALREFTKSSERRLEQLRRARAEQVQEGVEKKKSMATFFIVGAALLAVLGGVGLYVISRKATEGGKLATRQEEADVDAFLKDVKISFAAAKVARRGARRGGGGSSDAEFNNDSNFGDVTKLGAGGDETLDDDVIQNVMMGSYRSLVPCIMQERSRSPGLSDVSIDFVIRGTGRVSAVKVNGQRGGPFASCMLGRMQNFGFPKFNGSKTIASWSMSMR
jgi:serine/threonine-protein kinase